MENRFNPEPTEDDERKAKTTLLAVFTIEYLLPLSCFSTWLLGSRMMYYFFGVVCALMFIVYFIGTIKTGSNPVFVWFLALEAVAATVAVIVLKQNLLLVFPAVLLFNSLVTLLITSIELFPRFWVPFLVIAVGAYGIFRSVEILEVCSCVFVVLYLVRHSLQLGNVVQLLIDACLAALAWWVVSNTDLSAYIVPSTLGNVTISLLVALISSLFFQLVRHKVLKQLDYQHFE